MSLDDINDRLLAGGAKIMKFDMVGDEIAGTVIDAEYKPLTDFATREVKRWKDGTERVQLVLTLQTALRADADDDGQRRVFMKPDAEAKLRAELQRQRVRLERNGTVGIRFTGEEAAEIGRKKVFAVEYRPPVAQPVEAGRSILP